MKSALHYTILVTSSILVIVFSVLVTNAANPGAPFLPSDNVQDPGDPLSAWGGCNPTNSNCYVTTNSSQWTTSGLNIYYNTGKVGIGTASPTALLHVLQATQPAVSVSNGTTNNSPLTITGGNGGNTSFSTGTVTGGAAGNINITAGSGGSTTGTPTSGIGGLGGSINLLAGDGGLGTTIGGQAGDAVLQGGTAGNGTSPGIAGYAALKGGLAASTGNGDGGNIYLSPGIGNGTGHHGTTFLGVSPSLSIRGNTVIGAIVDDYTNVLQVTGNTALTGNLGVGTSTPNTFKIEVAGNIGPEADNTRDIGSSGKRFANIYATNLNPGFTQGSMVFTGSGGVLAQDNSGIFYDATNHSLGLGTTSPYSDLGLFQVRGTKVASLFSNAALASIREASTYNTSGGVKTSNALLISNSSTRSSGASALTNIGMYVSVSGAQNNYAAIFDQGNVGINQTSPGFALHIGSSSVVDGTTLLRLQDSNSTCDFNANTGAPTCGSDITLKKDISSLDTADLLTKISALNPVSYHWLTQDSSESLQNGFIAQEVEAQFPDLVSEHTWIDGSTKKFLNMSGLMPYVVGAVKEVDIKMAGLNDLTKDNSWRDALVAWLSNAGNHITRIFTGEICLTDTDGSSECINKTELHQLKQLLSTPPPQVEPPQPEPEQDIEVSGENNAESSNEQ